MAKGDYPLYHTDKPAFSSPVQEQNTTLEAVSSKQVEEIVLCFKNRIRQASAEQHISLVEYEWWMTEGVDTIMRDMPDPKQAMSAVTELMNAFETNIVLNKEKMTLIKKAEEKMAQGDFSQEERSLWQQKIQSIQEHYHQRTIGLQESFQQLQILVSVLSERSGDKKDLQKTYQGFMRIFKKSDLSVCPSLASLERDEKNFQSLPLEEKIDWAQKLHQLLEQEFRSFVHTYATFAHTAEVGRKWGQAETPAAKLKVLLQAHRTMQKGKEKREVEVQGIRLLIQQQEFVVATKQLQHLKTKLHPDTYVFFLFHQEEEKLHHMEAFQQQLLLMATRFEEAGQFSQAMDALHKAQDRTDRHDIPAVQQRILRLKQRQEARGLLSQAERFLVLGKKEEAQQYQERAKRLDPLLSSPLPQREDTPASSGKQVMGEINRQLETNKEWKILQEESQMIKQVQTKLVEDGISTLTKESGSAIKRTEQQIRTEEEKEQISLSIRKNTVSLHEQTTAKQENMIQMIIEKENVGEQVHSVLQDMKEGKRRAETISFKKSEQSLDPLSMLTVAELHRRKVTTFILQRTKEIGKKHGVTLELSPDDIRRLLQQAA